MIALGDAISGWRTIMLVRGSGENYLTREVWRRPSAAPGIDLHAGENSTANAIAISSPASSVIDFLHNHENRS
jgi:hypothetical protein